MKAIETLKGNKEITRFKGLGEISPNEFKSFIGDNIKLIPIESYNNYPIEKILSFYMGKNTLERQTFVIDNLRFEKI